MRRAVTAAAGALLAAGLLAAPATAHEEGWAGSEWRPGQERFTEPPAVAFAFVHDGPPAQPGIERVSLTLAVVTVGEVPPECLPPPVEDVVADPERDDPERFAAVVPLTVPCNGRYTVTAVAHTGANALFREEASPAIPLTFDAAVPPPAPKDVRVEAADVDGDTAARVSWTPPDVVPPDFVGYQIARSRSADDGFEVVGESVEPEFVDGEAADGGVFHYRVQSVRLGPTAAPDDLIASSPTASASVDLPTPSTTTTAGTSPTTARPSGDLSGFGTLQQQAARLRPGVAPPSATIQPGPVTTVDGGFEQTLPFDPAAPGAPTTAATPGEAGDGGLAAGGVSQIFEDDDPSDRKATVAPVAGALALLVVFLQLRWLLRQASSTA